MDDPYDLSLFREAQEPVIRRVLDELAEGRKQSHWMWFVFPQIAGLGRSAMAEKYALHSAAEACAYLADPILGPRLHRCTELVCAVEGRTAREILGVPDDMKFRSCMTLFTEAAPQEPLFRAALAKFFKGEPCPLTLEKLA
ncbi:DUF1810 domain-containing protein [Rhodoligotrophos appendicifer]|uniref:DUF1810 domain-containing protein n=1 Tax=Rhodoligotrophos appendicifer TaxID=987056 RepID=UPI0011867B38|nr:DUF1810 domain-containing protein [Rhodoligotrophos appendicifer]